jgi:uncharacterized protein
MTTLTTYFLRGGLLALAVLLTAPVVWAQDMDAVRQRMAERLPRVDALKVAGALGENHAGYLAVREATAEVEALAAAENQDRRLVYAEIARRAGADPQAVGQARARQIAAQSAPGIWLQRPDGEWYRK